MLWPFLLFILWSSSAAFGEDLATSTESPSQASSLDRTDHEDRHDHWAPASSRTYSSLGPHEHFFETDYEQETSESNFHTNGQVLHAPAASQDTPTEASKTVIETKKITATPNTGEYRPFQDGPQESEASAQPTPFEPMDAPPQEPFKRLSQPKLRFPKQKFASSKKQPAKKLPAEPDFHSLNLDNANQRSFQEDSPSLVNVQPTKAAFQFSRPAADFSQIPIPEVPRYIAEAEKPQEETEPEPIQHQNMPNLVHHPKFMRHHSEPEPERQLQEAQHNADTARFDQGSEHNRLYPESTRDLHTEPSQPQATKPPVYASTVYPRPQEFAQTPMAYSPNLYNPGPAAGFEPMSMQQQPEYVEEPPASFESISSRNPPKQSKTKDLKSSDHDEFSLVFSHSSEFFLSTFPMARLPFFLPPFPAANLEALFPPFSTLMIIVFI